MPDVAGVFRRQAMRRLAPPTQPYHVTRCSARGGASVQRHASIFFEPLDQARRRGAINSTASVAPFETTTRPISAEHFRLSRPTPVSVRTRLQPRPSTGPFPPRRIHICPWGYLVEPIATLPRCRHGRCDHHRLPEGAHQVRLPPCATRGSRLTLLSNQLPPARRYTHQAPLRKLQQAGCERLPRPLLRAGHLRDL